MPMKISDAMMNATAGHADSSAPTAPCWAP
jgi:hypothetical protein